MPAFPDRFRAAVAAGLVLTGAVCAQGMLISGTVTDDSSMPIANARVSLGGLLHDTTDATGTFRMESDSLAITVGIRSGRVSETNAAIQVFDSRLELRDVKGMKIGVALVSMTGRARLLLPEMVAATSIVHVPLNPANVPAAGVYIMRIQTGERTQSLRCIVNGGRYGLQQPSSRPSFADRGMPKSLASSYMLMAMAPGYLYDTTVITRDTVVGITLQLGALPATVNISLDSESVAFRVPVIGSGAKPQWAAGSSIRSYEATARNQVSVARTYNTVTFDNGLIRLVASPDLGMRIIRVIDKTTYPERMMFELFTNPANPTSFAQNHGGVKPAFPYHENSTGMIDDAGKLSYKAGYYTEPTDIGGARLIMSMRFDDQQAEMDAGFLGKNGDCPLTCEVTVQPGHNDFKVKYVANNPNPLRRGNRIWTDALYPAMTSADSWIFPTRFAIDHFCASKLYDIATNGVKGSASYSYFALYSPYPFAGAYYASANASHLRVTPDPVAYPGMKIYNATPKELWGSTSCHFEAPEEKWVNAFEPNYLEHSYYMTRGMGKVTYANERVAISMENGTFKICAPVAATVAIYDFDATTDPINPSAIIGPQSIVSGSFTNGLRVVAGDTVLCNVRLPLVYDDNSARFSDLTASAGLSGCQGLSVLDTRFGVHYELENIASKYNFLSSLAVLLAHRNVTTADNADVLISMANTAYRHGGFGAVDTILAAVGDRRPQESSYLRALMSLERHEPADFTNATVEGNYFSALADAAVGDTTAALAHTAALLAERPRAIRPLLLRAWLTRDTSYAMTALRLDAGCIETWTTLRELGVPGAAERVAGLAGTNAMASIASSDFVKELTTGSWRHGRRYEYDAAWFENVSLPVFPGSLKYVVPGP